jgi:Tfp pilus assembly protein PilV
MAFLQRTTKMHILNNRGDTIIEVLISIAVIGAVMGGAYATANKNTKINQASQERLVAIKIAESQLERLKAAADTNAENLFTHSDFCLDQAGAIVQPSSNSACHVNALGQPTGADPVYSINIARGVPAYTSGAGIVIGYPYTVRVVWPSVMGTGDDNVTYKFGVYK